MIIPPYYQLTVLNTNKTSQLCSSDDISPSPRNWQWIILPTAEIWLSCIIHFLAAMSDKQRCCLKTR